MDPIADMMNSIKNGARAGKPVVTVAHSNIKEAIAQCLVRGGYAVSFEKKIRHDRPYLDVILTTSEKAVSVHDVTRISKPSRRTYRGVKELRSYKNGSGMFVLSTPKGILSDKEAKKEAVGGELLFSIW